MKCRAWGPGAQYSKQIIHARDVVGELKYKCRESTSNQERPATTNTRTSRQLDLINPMRGQHILTKSISKAAGLPWAFCSRGLEGHRPPIYPSSVSFQSSYLLSRTFRLQSMILSLNYGSAVGTTCYRRSYWSNSPEDCQPGDPTGGGFTRDNAMVSESSVVYPPGGY